MIAGERSGSVSAVILRWRTPGLLISEGELPESVSSGDEAMCLLVLATEEGMRLRFRKHNVPVSVDLEKGC